MKPSVSFAMKRTEVFLGKPLRGGESNVYHVRLNTVNNKWTRNVHEVWETNEKVIKLNSPIIHNSTDSIADFLEKLNDYSTKNAEQYFNEKVIVYWWDLLLYPTGKFLQLYIVKRGFLDGTHGFVHAMMMSFHSFLTRGKLWLLYKRNPESISQIIKSHS